MPFQTRVHFFLLQNTKEDILKNVGNQTVLVPSDFLYMDKIKTVRRFSKYFLLWPKEKSQSFLEQYEGE